jgi:hypothetical protein
MSTDLESAREVNPMTILDRLTSQNVDPDKLGKVIDLVRDWNADQAKKSFHRALVCCQREVGDVIDDAKNTQTGSTYALLETVQRVCKPVYTRWGFALSWSEVAGPVKDGLREIIMTARHEDGHQELHYGHYNIDGEGPKGGKTMNPLQGAVSAHTYAQRDMMRQFFNLVLAGQDRDGNEWVPLTDDQVKQINTLLERCHTETPDFNSQTFWDWIHGEDNTKKRLHELSATLFERAVRGLTKKLRDGK